MRSVLLFFLVCGILVLRHDFWNWHRAEPILWFLPVGLWWQVMVTLLASLTMWLLVRFAWPKHLENPPLMTTVPLSSHKNGFTRASSM